MPALSNIRLGWPAFVSPLTDRVFLGTVKKPGVFVDKVDVTSQFCGALLAWVPPGTGRIVTDGGKTIEIIVRESRSRTPVVAH